MIQEESEKMSQDKHGPIEVSHAEMAETKTDRQETIDDVMPKYGAKWYKQTHLIKLNFFLMICMFSSTSNGYDGSF